MKNGVDLSMVARSHVSKISKTVFLAVLATVVVLLAFISLPVENKGGIKFASEPKTRRVSLDVSAAKWTKHTYLNASDFKNLLFDGEDAFYYENAASKEEQYSMDASITSPKLDIFPTEYAATIKFFTKQKSNVPNRISAYVSEDGENFVLSDYIDVSGVGTERKWREATLSLKGKVSYVRFVFTVYYSKDAVDGGIYFAENFTLTSDSTSDYSDADFGLTFDESVAYDEKTNTVSTSYIGFARYPEFTVVSNTNLDFYTRVRATTVTDEAVSVEPITVGSYRLFIDVYGDLNEKIVSFEKNWELKPLEVTATGDFALYNDDCIAFYGLKFVSAGGAVFSAEDVGVATIHKKKNGSDTLSSVVFEAKNFSVKGFDDENSINSAKAENGVLYAINDGEYEYDGSGKDAKSLITAFKTLDESGNPVPVTNEANVSYYKDGEKLEDGQYPTNAAEYTFVIECGQYSPTGKITINPKKITELSYNGQSSFYKIYDGTKIVAQGGKFVDTLEGIEFTDVNREKIAVKCGAEYGREKGTTYILAENCSENSGNYVFEEKTLIAGVKAVISPSTLVLRTATDETEAETAFESRQYDGTDVVTISGEPDDALDVIGAADDVIAIKDVTAKADDKNVGVRNVTLAITNETLFDRFAPIIKTENTPQITIYPKQITATGTIEDAVKVYDGTTSASPKITEIAIAEGTETELADAMKKGYSVSYETATYDTAAAGTEKTITITNATLLANDAETEIVFANYVIPEITANGAIDPKPIEVVTKQMRVYKGEALPDPETTEAKTGILAMTIYKTQEEAEEGDKNNALPSRLDAIGEYFVRTECTDGNYKLDPVVIPLFVTDNRQREQQFIVFDDFNPNVTPSVIVPVGSKFSLGAKSVTADGTNTGIELSYKIIDGTISAEETADGIFVAEKSGTFSIIVSASGNGYYSDAESVEINVEAKKIVLTGSCGETPFTVGDALPTSGVTFSYDKKVVEGSFRPADETETLKNGTNSYDYIFTSAARYSEININYGINEVLYEKTENGYVKTTDKQYEKGKKYYRVSDTVVAVTEGEELPENCYEKNKDGSFVKTTDAVASADKSYVTLETSEFNAISVTTDGYYVASVLYAQTDKGYREIVRDEYDKTKTYYRVFDTTVAVTEGEELPENCYEKNEDGSFIKTNASSAERDKTYVTLEVIEYHPSENSTDDFFVEYKPVAIGSYFDSGDTYYVKGKAFFGEKQASVSITASRASVTLFIEKKVESAYSEAIDFKKFVQEIKLTQPNFVLPIAELQKFNGKISLIKVTVNDGTAERTIIDEKSLYPKVYTVYSYGSTYTEDDEYYEIKADDDEFEYEILFEGNATLEIVKSKVRVIAPIKEKYYFTNAEADENLLSEIKLDGTIGDADAETVRKYLSLKSFASKRTTVGAYAIMPYLESDTSDESKELTDKYEFEFVQGYVEVLPTKITVSAISDGQTYGDEKQGAINIIVTLSDLYSEEDKSEIAAIIASSAEATISVDDKTNVGSYPINIKYNGDTKNYSIIFGDSIYTVFPAILQGFSFSNESVLYDGERHTLKVVYDEEKWQNVTVTYDRDYFVDKGVYVYTATVSAKNYKTLTLKATLTIGTLTIESSNLTGNVVSITLNKDECPNGLSPDLYVLYRAKSSDDADLIKQKLEDADASKKYEIVSAFDIVFYLDGNEQSYINYPSYEIYFKTDEFAFSDNLKLYGYRLNEDGKEEYGELSFTYGNGTYKTNATRLVSFAFVTEEEITVSPIVIWICVGIFAVIILILLGIVLGNGKSAKRARTRSKKRHHRWA